MLMSSHPFVQRYRDYLMLHFVILIWGFTGILGKVITVPYFSIVIYRMGIAFVGLFLFFLWKKRKFETNKKAIAKFMLVGIIVGAHWATFFQALKVSNVSVVLTTLASTSLFVAFLEPLFFKRRVIPYEVFFGLVGIAGLYLIFNFESQFQLGIMLALCSSFCAALFGTLNGILVRDAAPGQITMYEMLGGLMAMALYTLLYENVQPGDLSPSFLDLAFLLILGLVCTAFAFVTSVQIVKVLSPFTVSISINMEPIYAIVLALLFFGESEKMTSGFYLGAALILSTVIGNGAIKAYYKKRQRKLNIQV